jgi:N-methylhydantoinase A
LRHVSVEQGHDPRDATLVPFGGAGPLHACALAEALGISHILVPRFPGVLSALGMTLGSPTRDYRRSVLRPVAGLDDAALAGLLAPLLDQARSEAGPAAQLLPALDLRYTGQSFELTVSHTSDLAGTVAAFHAAHQARYGYHRPGRALELVTVRVRAVTASAACVPAYQPSERPAAAAARQVWCDTGWASAAVLQRQALPVGAAVQGPALLLQDDATTLIEPGWQGVVDAAGNLLLHRSA